MLDDDAADVALVNELLQVVDHVAAFGLDRFPASLRFRHGTLQDSHHVHSRRIRSRSSKVCTRAWRPAAPGAVTQLTSSAAETPAGFRRNDGNPSARSNIRVKRRQRWESG